VGADEVIRSGMLGMLPPVLPMAGKSLGAVATEAGLG
jgi:hypothetical protein